MAFSCCLGEEERLSMRISREIDREIERWKKDNSKEYKLLLLGTGEAGKSTFIKQMRIIHGAGYSDKDRKEFAPLVSQNIWMAVTALYTAMGKLQIPYSDSSLETQIGELLRVSDGGMVVSEHRNLIGRMWQDGGVQDCYARRNEFQISDSAKHYLNSLDRICTPSYIPTVEDVLRVRVPTTGIIEYPFQMKKDVIFRMVDVGGQRTERRKWIHCFEGVKAIIFLVAISEYDQVLYEDWNQNRMAESLALFSNIMGYPFFASSSIILFLNKVDLFEEKILHSHLADYYPDFKGPKGDAKAGKEFILDQFESVAKMDSNKRFFHHFTCATDTENIKRVFNAVREQVLEDNLRDYNLM